MIDSPGRPASSIEAVFSVSDGMPPSNAVDQYAFVDEASASTVQRQSMMASSKRGLKRTFEDMIKKEDFNCTPSMATRSGFEAEEECSNLTTNLCASDLGPSGSGSKMCKVSSMENSPSSSSDFSLEQNDNGLWTGRLLDSNNNNSNSSNNRGNSRRSRAYGLRPRNNLRRSIDDRDSPERPGRKPTRRGRGRNATLSKYRRNTANARERDRMREINLAFATLRGVLPSVACRRISSMTKITTLKLATNYIRDLSNLLKEPPMENSHPSMNSANIFMSTSLSGCYPSEASTSRSQGSQPPVFGLSSFSEPLHQSQSLESCGGDSTLSQDTIDDGKALEGQAFAPPPHNSAIGGTIGTNRVEGRWWSAVESEVLDALNTEIPWDDLSLSDLCWSTS